MFLNESLIVQVLHFCKGWTPFLRNVDHRWKWCSEYGSIESRIDLFRCLDRGLDWLESFETKNFSAVLQWWLFDQLQIDFDRCDFKLIQILLQLNDCSLIDRLILNDTKFVNRIRSMDDGLFSILAMNRNIDDKIIQSIIELHHSIDNELLESWLHLGKHWTLIHITDNEAFVDDVIRNKRIRSIDDYKKMMHVINDYQLSEEHLLALFNKVWGVFNNEAVNTYHLKRLELLIALLNQYDPNGEKFLKHLLRAEFFEYYDSDDASNKGPLRLDPSLFDWAMSNGFNDKLMHEFIKYQSFTIVIKYLIDFSFDYKKANPSDTWSQGCKILDAFLPLLVQMNQSIDESMIDFWHWIIRYNFDSNIVDWIIRNGQKFGIVEPYFDSLKSVSQMFEPSQNYVYMFKFVKVESLRFIFNRCSPSLIKTLKSMEFRMTKFCDPFVFQMLQSEGFQLNYNYILFYEMFCKALMLFDLDLLQWFANHPDLKDRLPIKESLLIFILTHHELFITTEDHFDFVFNYFADVIDDNESMLDLINNKYHTRMIEGKKYQLLHHCYINRHINPSVVLNIESPVHKKFAQFYSF